MDRPASPRPLQILGSDLTPLVQALRTARRVGVDTESDPFHRYFERVCLIQISTEDHDFFVDPLAEGFDQGALAALLGREDGPEWVLHGADGDVRALKQSLGLRLGTLFDTQLAAQFTGQPRTGLKDLLASLLGVEIDKGEQRSDWGRRPLSAQQIAYARQDTQHLVALAATLEDQLRALGRLQWHEEECGLVRGREPTERVFDPESWRKIKGSRELRGPGRRALAAAVAWRDEVARAEDCPAFRVVRSEALLRLARELDRQFPEAQPDAAAVDFTGSALMNPRVLPKESHRMALFDAVLQGLAAPDPGRNRPRPPGASPGKTGAPHTKALLDRLRAARTEWATELGMDPGFLMSTAVLEKIARDTPQTVAQLREIPGISEWRCQALGDRILGLTAVIQAEKRC